MDIGTKIKRGGAGAVCILAVALIGYNAYQYRQVRALTQHSNSGVPGDAYPAEGIPAPVNAPEAKMAAGTVGDSDAGDSGERAEIAALAYQLSAAEEELDMVYEQLAEREEEKEKLLQMEYEAAKKRYENPASEVARRKSSSRRFERQYEPLLFQLNLSPEDRERFIGLLVDEKMASTESFVSIEDDPERGRQVVSGIRSKEPGQWESHQPVIEELLGDAGYEAYLEYKEKSADANEAMLFNESLKAEDQLTGEQQWELIGAMYEAAERERALTVIDPDKADITEEMMDQRDRVYGAYLEAAGGILSASQYEQLESYLDHARGTRYFRVTQSTSDGSEDDGGAADE